MIKFLLIVLVIGYVLFRGLGLVMRFLFGGIAAQKTRGYQNHTDQQSKPKNGNVNIDYVPSNKNREKLPDNFKGGEYVDYEEVK